MLMLLLMTTAMIMVKEAVFFADGMLNCKNMASAVSTCLKKCCNKHIGSSEYKQSFLHKQTTKYACRQYVIISELEQIFFCVSQNPLTDSKVSLPRRLSPSSIQHSVSAARDPQGER